MLFSIPEIVSKMVGTLLLGKQLSTLYLVIASGDLIAANTAGHPCGPKTIDESDVNQDSMI